MSDSFEYIPPAETTYKDWVGTAAAENSMIKTSGDLYELAGLDHEKWSILSVDMYTFSHGEDPDWTIRVCAFDRSYDDGTIRNYEQLKALEAERGSIPVTEIELHNASLDDVVRCMKVIHFQLRSPHFPTLDRVAYGDHPPQD